MPLNWVAGGSSGNAMGVNVTLNWGKSYRREKQRVCPPRDYTGSRHITFSICWVSIFLSTIFIKRQFNDQIGSNDGFQAHSKITARKTMVRAMYGICQQPQPPSLPQSTKLKTGSSSLKRENKKRDQTNKSCILCRTCDVWRFSRGWTVVSVTPNTPTHARRMGGGRRNTFQGSPSFSQQSRSLWRHGRSTVNKG